MNTKNVFKDLGLEDAEDLLVKSHLALHIRQAMKLRKLTQTQTAQILGIDQPKVSHIINGHLDGYSTERLMRFLKVLGCDIRMSISAPHSKERGHVMVG